MNGKRLRILRTSKELTQGELGNALNVTKATISQYENEIRKPDSNMLNKIADFFNVTVDYLLGRTDIRTPYDQKLRELEEFLMQDDITFGGEPLDEDTKRWIPHFLELTKKMLAKRKEGEENLHKRMPPLM